MIRLPLCRLLWVAAVFALLLTTALAIEEVIPPRPKNWFNDEAGVVAPEVAARLNRELKEYEQATSNQIVVAIYPKMLSPSSIEDYTVRVAEKWGVGQKGRDNGAVLFVFIQDRKVYIQVGYGLEGVLTDYLCHQIIQNEIIPAFRKGDYSEGIVKGTHALMAAAKDEYKATKAGDDDDDDDDDSLLDYVIYLFVLWVLWEFAKFVRNPRGLPGKGRSILFDWDDFFGGGGSSGGGSGGGGFRGGGGRFGGGGAGGSW